MKFLVVAILFIGVIEAGFTIGSSRSEQFEVEDEGLSPKSVATKASGKSFKNEKREVKVNAENTKFKIEAKTKTGTRKNEIRYEIATSSEGIEFKVDYKEKTEDTKSKFEFRVRISELIEYINLDGVPGLTGDDSILQAIRLGKDADWEDIDVTKKVVKDVPIHFFSVKDKKQVCTFKTQYAGQFVSYTAPQGVNTVKYDLYPSLAKFDIAIKDFPYSAAYLTVGATFTQTPSDTNAVASNLCQYVKDAISEVTSGEAAPELLCTITQVDDTLSYIMKVHPIEGEAVLDLVQIASPASLITPVKEKLDAGYTYSSFTVGEEKSSLCVKAKIKAKTKLKTATTSSKIVTQDGGLEHGTFKWQPTVIADGVSVDVVKPSVAVETGVLTEETGDKNYESLFCFATDEKVRDILWDPLIGVEKEETSAACLASKLWWLTMPALVLGHMFL